MYKLIVFVLLYIVSYLFVYANDIFHENSKVMFRPEDFYSEGYFGFSVVVYRYGLLVGAPKARSKENPAIYPGNVFNCSLADLNTPSVKCFPVGSNESNPNKEQIRRILNREFIKDNMWYGASIATLTDGKVMICAPRWALPYKDKHLLANGACYLWRNTRDNVIYPLRESSRQAFVTDGRRKEYGEYGTHLNFYAYGQAGISVKVTTNNTVIIGAPGLLQWTGGILNFKFDPAEESTLVSKQPTTNPYFTNDLEPDDYLGYSVESGIFETNGQVLYVGGAPRAKMGYGQVIIFEQAWREQDALKTHAKIKGSQLGAYFGASLCCMDIDGDGRSDLLIGAPNYVNKNAGLPHDQGVVFVYMTKEKENGFILEESGFVSGSGANGGKFGTAIAELGDIDGDGFNDVAIGAPWENDGSGVVYIYRGNNKGLKTKHLQRIIAQKAKGFGISISKGYDVDHNNCSDLIIGAYGNDRAYLYRCVPTIQIHASINVPDAMSLPQNATGFTALFCVSVPATPLWPNVKLDLRARIIIDPEENRAHLSGDSGYIMTVKPGNDVCDEQNVEVSPSADLSRPISMKFELEPISQNDSTTFPMDGARISEDSKLHYSFLIQLVRDCGEDLICTPWLVMTLEALKNPYVPGTDTKFGVVIKVLNKEEPAYGARVNITLPSTPVRIPRECSLKELNMTCNVPAPLHRNEEVVWELDLEHPLKKINDVSYKFVAVLEDLLFSRNITNDTVKEIVIDVTSEANFSVSGKNLPNVTIPITREKLNTRDNVTFSHYYEVTNTGPSDWYDLEAIIALPEMVNLSNSLKGCLQMVANLVCTWTVPAKASKLVVLQLFFDLDTFGEILKENTTLNITTKMIITAKEQIERSQITTTLILDPAPPIWPYIVGLIVGLLVLAIIIYTIAKCGFFSRSKRDRLKQLKEMSAQEQQSNSGSSMQYNEGDESTHDLITDDSE